MRLIKRDVPGPRWPPRPIRSVGVLLLPGYSLMSYACSIEPLRAANALSGRPLYAWTHVSLDGKPAQASNGAQVLPDAAVGDRIDPDLLLVCAGGNPTTFDDPRTFAWMRQVARRGAIVGGVSGGTYSLARAGLLRGRRCTIHWEHVPAFVEEFPDIDLTRNLFEIDGDRISCSGGIAALEMMHAIIGAEHGHELASDVVEWFLHTHVRSGDGPQRMAVRDRLSVGDPKLVRVLERMEASLEELCSRRALARIAGVSVRQLERLFKSHLGRTVSAHYKELRLRRARLLIRQSGLPVLEVAVACGFVSASHFSRAYRARFGHPPRTELRAHLHGRVVDAAPRRRN
ncbi:MAG: GlxA family transcriptional regulator [Alphaproteobacteria bacterium]|jgi:transcriptional regulator GlxA family with amidase domain